MKVQSKGSIFDAYFYDGTVPSIEGIPLEVVAHNLGNKALVVVVDGIEVSIHPGTWIVVNSEGAPAFYQADTFEAIFKPVED